MELQFSAQVDNYFKGSAIFAIGTDDAEVETAEIETTGLPYGLKLKGGKFFSDFGIINAQHSHERDFSDQPLIYKLCLGTHGLNDEGLQFSWTAPTAFYLSAGAEVFQGNNDYMFSYTGDAPLQTHKGPRTMSAWLKVRPDLAENHLLQFGFSGAKGKHQEAHDGNSDGEMDHWMDGDSTFLSADFLYKHLSDESFGKGDITIQGEYFIQSKNLQLVKHELIPDLLGNSKRDKQDGYYIQAVYGFRPHWRAGLRWEETGLTNDSTLPNGHKEIYGSSCRASAMLDFSPSESSRIRLQANRGFYETSEGSKDATEFYLQWIVSLGEHPEHKF